jgi:hypothetical protein
VRGHEPERLRALPMCEWNACICRAGDRGGDPRHDLVFDPRSVQRFELFAAAAKDERIPTLEPHDPAARARMSDHQLMNLLLRHRVHAGGLAHGDPGRVAARELEHLVRNQPVVQDHVGLLQCAQRVQRQQAGISGSCTDQHD